MALNKEPTVIINGLAGLATQILPLMVILGLIQLSPEKLAATITVIGLILTFISTTLLRSQVTSNVKANEQIDTAIEMTKDPMTKTPTIAEVITENESKQ